MSKYSIYSSKDSMAYLCQFSRDSQVCSSFIPNFTQTMRIFGPQSQSGCSAAEKCLFNLDGIGSWKPGNPACSLITILTELPYSYTKYINISRSVQFLSLPGALDNKLEKIQPNLAIHHLALQYSVIVTRRYCCPKICCLPQIPAILTLNLTKFHTHG